MEILLKIGFSLVVSSFLCWNIPKETRHEDKRKSVPFLHRWAPGVFLLMLVATFLGCHFFSIIKVFSVLVLISLVLWYMVGFNYSKGEKADL